MLLKVGENPTCELKNMHVSDFASMCLFHPVIQGDKLSVEYRPPGMDKASHQLEVPLYPSLEKLEKVNINMHHSPTRGYNMGEQYNKWFSERFGFKVIFAFWGENPRLVMGNRPGRLATEVPRPKSSAINLLRYIPVIGSKLLGTDAVIAFNDCAPYLIITEKSGEDASSRLPDGVSMDLTKFRANIVVQGSPTAYDEDFWGELRFGTGTSIILTANCARCNSLNVDYETGKSGTGKAGQFLKLLAKDRRVDPGTKYSPVFGRYGFVGKRDEGKLLKVGDEVVVSHRNEERTRFCKLAISLLGLLFQRYRELGDHLLIIFRLAGSLNLRIQITILISTSLVT